MKKQTEINALDLADAINILEKSALVSDWSITRISDPGHVSVPIGKGFGILVSCGPTKIWEKAGGEMKLVPTVKRAINRLAQEMGEK